MSARGRLITLIRRHVGRAITRPPGGNAKATRQHDALRVACGWNHRDISVLLGMVREHVGRPQEQRSEFAVAHTRQHDLMRHWARMAEVEAERIADA